MFVNLKGYYYLVKKRFIIKFHRLLWNLFYKKQDIIQCYFTERKDDEPKDIR